MRKVVIFLIIPILFSCKSDKNDFYAAKEINTIEAYEEFILKNEESIYADSAHHQIRIIYLTEEYMKKLLIFKTYCEYEEEGRSTYYIKDSKLILNVHNVRTNELFLIATVKLEDIDPNNITYEYGTITLNTKSSKDVIKWYYPRRNEVLWQDYLYITTGGGDIKPGMDALHYLIVNRDFAKYLPKAENLNEKVNAQTKSPRATNNNPCDNFSYTEKMRGATTDFGDWVNTTIWIICSNNGEEKKITKSVIKGPSNFTRYSYGSEDDLGSLYNAAKYACGCD
jgi:hypothetical protein